MNINLYCYIRISQPLNMLNIKPVMRFIRISNARNSVNFCTIFPCAKDSSWTRRKINLRSDELNGGPFSRRLIFCWIDIINSIYSLNLCWEIRIDPLLLYAHRCHCSQPPGFKTHIKLYFKEGWRIQANQQDFETDWNIKKSPDWVFNDREQGLYHFWRKCHSALSRISGSCWVFEG